MRGLTLETLRTHHVAAYVELLGKHYSAPTVKQHLAAVRMLFDWLVVRQVIEMNPAAAVRGPKYVVKRGKTPVLEAEEARLDFPPWSGGVRSERHAAARMVIPSMLARASAGVR